jgi:hypothetical protein
MRKEFTVQRIALKGRILALLLLSPALTHGAGAQARTIEPPRPLQTMVWVNASTKIYHCPGSRYYGETTNGEYMSEAVARAHGNRAEGRTGCPSTTGPGAPLRPLSPGQVWINTESGLYHCPGTRSYGNTKRGKFLPESEARSAGHHPAGRRSCP